ncbi:hypothetical protein PVC01_000011900 [Plasmodium vivax]|uniref:VIR protein n=1 Tax=Plasmodium vivax TaxID=5855 RepID=A0A1G4E972_PLAVI|nr:hypothetical protein PVC01_000011900 [Plasmodium vivax]
MTSPVSDAKYIVYNLYDEIKRQFDRSDTFEHKKTEFDNIINDINIESNELESLEKIFKKLHKTLKNSSVFYNGHLIDSYCIFVNFWLNKELRGKYNLVNDTKFNIFQNFVYYSNKRGFGLVDNTCHGYIKYLNPDVYNRMLILDDLYDKYKQLDLFNGPENDTLCSIFSAIRQNYMTAIANNQNDRNFIKKLEEYPRLIEKNKWATNKRCPAKNYITLPEKNPPKPREIPETSNQPKASQQASASQDLSTAQDTVLLGGISGKQATQELPKPSGIREVSASSEFVGSDGEQETQHTPGPQYSLRRRITELPADPENDELFRTQERSAMALNEQIYTLPGHDKAYADVMMRGVDGRITELNSNPHTMPKDGLLDKVQDFFTGTLGQVDPVPVVGVSGGMGALFLLFRYTPVGTYFRGGRGRAHRIPRSFNGQFLGGFPGYDDYDVGHIGYGPMNPLAE